MQEKDDVYADPTLNAEEKMSRYVSIIDEMKRIEGAASGDLDGEGLIKEFGKRLGCKCVIR